MIKENIERVRQRISAVCARINVCPHKISIVCVTKGRTLEQIAQVIGLGYKDIGENRVQEASEKHKQIFGAKWHMIGHLQSNKTKEAVRIFDLIHSVDSVGLAREINRQAIKINKTQDVILEVKTSEEKTKFGFVPVELQDAAIEICKLSNLSVKGLMTIAPLMENSQETRKYFSLVRKLRDRLNPRWLLSMGMSDDFEIAIEEGADIIRLGRVIFEG
ncbi:MAG: YggS family pyridoxal phosphate-dependent enzyme [Candidatus Omnitrophica bacterium]|nr:YggS family pyridoxal phosphate-dependent enzyme [Candidatus Omnitrophota bacterium]MDD5660969.1 YggS family pyridoxal phosphate-dependent enzyme [Candidatus Omnitrophota bacterium]